jgi:AcrR family transcriptional regulator
MTAPKRLNSKERRQVLLNAAREVFLERGFSGARLDMVIEKAGGSRRSVYNEFGGKDGLFLAIIEETIQKMFNDLPTAAAIRGWDLPKKLTAVATAYLKVIIDPEIIGLFRMVQMELFRFPKVVEYFYEAGPKKALDRVRDILEEAQNEGQVKALDSALAAEHFLSLLRAKFHFLALLGLGQPPTKPEFKAFVKATVDLFMAGVAKSG